MKEYIKSKIKILMSLHNTKDIYKLCEIYNINIIDCDIKLKGLFLVIKNDDFIFLKKGLSPQEREDKLIHEFAHFMLHRNEILNQNNKIT